MSTRLAWDRDGRDWPLRSHSRFVTAAGLNWHLQRLGPQATGPRVLLLHGTGAATHTWRGLAPLLAPHADVLALDLPGHGFTSAPPNGQASLPHMATALAGLLAEVAFEPDLVLGHSAGAAVMLRLALDQRWQDRRLVSLNGALLPFEGLAGLAYAPMARLLARNPLVSRLAAWRGHNAAAVRRLIESTGSQIDDAGVAQYQLLMGNPGHVNSVLAMMAQWDLRLLQSEWTALRCPLLLLAAAGDTAVPPAQAQRVALRMPTARVQGLPGLGHLAHEEAPVQVATVVLRELKLLVADQQAQGRPAAA